MPCSSNNVFLGFLEVGLMFRSRVWVDSENMSHSDFALRTAQWAAESGRCRCGRSSWREWGQKWNWTRKPSRIIPVCSELQSCVKLSHDTDSLNLTELQSDPSAQQLHFVDFDCLFQCLPYYAWAVANLAELACHGGTPKSKSTKYSRWPDGSPCMAIFQLSSAWAKNSQQSSQHNFEPPPPSKQYSSQ